MSPFFTKSRPFSPISTLFHGSLDRAVPPTAASTFFTGQPHLSADRTSTLFSSDNWTDPFRPPPRRTFSPTASTETILTDWGLRSDADGQRHAVATLARHCSWFVIVLMDKSASFPIGQVSRPPRSGQGRSGVQRGNKIPPRIAEHARSSNDVVAARMRVWPWHQRSAPDAATRSSR